MRRHFSWLDGKSNQLSAPHNLGWRVEQDQRDDGWITMDEQAFDDNQQKLKQSFPKPSVP